MYDYFGESSLVMGVCRSADVIALTDVTLLAIKRGDFLRFIQGTRARERMLRQHQNRRYRTWALMDRHPILSSINTAQRNELQSFMTRVELAPGERLFKAGQPSAAALIATGALQTCGEPEALVHEAGSLVINPLAVVEREPEKFDVIAREETVAFVFDTDQMAEFLESYPGLYLRLLHESA